MPTMSKWPAFAGRSVILYLAPPRVGVLARLVDLVAEELHCVVLGLPEFDWTGCDEACLDSLFCHEKFLRAMTDLSHYNHIAVATFSELYPTTAHLEWLKRLGPDRRAALKPLAQKSLSFISAGEGTAVSESFRSTIQQAATILNMTFLGGVHVQSEGALRYSRAVGPVTEYVGRVSQFYAA